ncbi:MAG TPA: fibronectin type III domain-containing protein [Anaerolineae bacterium]|nr:fibronectin type III domain-containing protein [Anaerolineae bacterium]
MAKLVPTAPITRGSRSWADGVAVDGRTIALHAGAIFEVRGTEVLSLEAESGTVVAPMAIGFDQEASGGRYVYAPVGTTSGRVDLEFRVDTAGEYEVWGRAFGIEGIGDSFWFAIDGGTECVWELPWHGWEIVPVVDRDANRSAKRWNLGQGQHVLHVRMRESGAKLDWLEVRRVRPSSAVPVAAGPTPTPVGTLPSPGCGVPQPLLPVGGSLFYCEDPVRLEWSGDCSEYKVQFLFSGAAERSIGWTGSKEVILPAGGIGWASWRIKGRNQVGQETAWSTPSIYRVGDNPLNLRVVGASCDQITLAWDPPCSCYADWYTVYSGTQSIASTHDHVPVKTVGGLSPETEYSFAVRACYRRGYSSDLSRPISATTTAAYLYQEAESGVVQAPMVAEADATASGGRCVRSAAANSGSVTIQVCLMDAGTYDLWGRVAAPGYGGDSFWVSVDGSAEALWEIPVGDWKWAQVSHQGVKRTYQLDPGSHYINVRAREAGARLDAMQLVKSGNPLTTPTTTPQVSATPSATRTATASPTWTATQTASPTASATATRSVTPTPTASPSATVTRSATPTPSATPEPTASATATATPTPPGDLLVTGQVYDAVSGPLVGVAGAEVAVSLCMPRRFSTLADDDGNYELILPAIYLNQCSSVTLEAVADGYRPVSFVVLVADLRAQSRRDLALVPLPTPTPSRTATWTPQPRRCFLPMLLR